jgi:hypothetical protein
MIMNTRQNDTTQVIRKVARIEDKATGQFLEEIEFYVSATEKRRIQLLPSIVSDPSRLESSLIDRGALLPEDSQERKSLLVDVAKSEAANNYVFEAQGGWLEPGKTFVLADGAISAETTNIIGVSPTVAVDDPSGRRTSSGSLISWHDTIGQTSRLSSLLMFAISVPFAAPLLAIARSQSFGFCIYGKTRSGKTIATLVGSSVIGIGQTENLIGWNITDARLEQRLAEFRDLPFPIDDLSTMTGGSKERYLRTRNIAYRVSQGWSTARHSSFTRVNEGVHGGWRCILLTSSEKAVRDLAREAKVERQPGEVLRLIDTPAIPDGSDHIFDRRSTALQIQDFKSWRDKTFANIAADCEANHGAVLKPYLERLITADFDVATMIQEAGAFFTRHVIDAADDVVARDVAGKFGLVYAGGLLGIRFGIVPWQQEELLDAISKCYRGARNQLPDEGVALRQGLATLEDRLRRLDRRKTLNERQLTQGDWNKIDGYRMWRSGQNRFVIKREVFNALFATTTQKDLVLKWLIENGRITTAVGKGEGVASDAPKPKKQFIWPDGQRRRSYKIVFPAAN